MKLSSELRAATHLDDFKLGLIYLYPVIRFRSRGPGRSPRIRHRDQLTYENLKAYDKAAQKLGKTLRTSPEF